MNLNKIQQALNTSFPEDSKRRLILAIISEDKDALPDILHILNTEREQNRELISEMNLQLSRADVCIQEPKLAKKDFVVGEISKFYHENQSLVKHCFPKTKTI